MAIPFLASQLGDEPYNTIRERQEQERDPNRRIEIKIRPAEVARLLDWIAFVRLPDKSFFYLANDWSSVLDWISACEPSARVLIHVIAPVQ